MDVSSRMPCHCELEGGEGSGKNREMAASQDDKGAHPG
jgi:hypothetical protein